MGKQDEARRLEGAIVDLQRITNSRRLHAARSARSGVAIGPVAGSVLRHVALDGPIRPAALGQQMRMTPPALSRQLGNLEAEGLVERVPSPGDGRGSLVRITRRGRGLIGRLEQADDEILLGQLRHWSTADIRQLNDLLDRLIDDLRAPAPTAAAATPASAATPATPT